MDSSIFVPRQEDLGLALAEASTADVVLFAQQYLRVGDSSGAAAVCQAARAAGLTDPAIVLSEATARFAMGSQSEAMALADGVLAAAPGHLGALNLKAHMQAALGERAESVELIRRVIDGYADFPGALTALATWTMPGLYYRDVLSRLHARLSPRTYLEIGVESGATLALARTATRAVGVDPVSSRISQPLPENARLYQVESDAFFANESKETVFDGSDVDLTFIDGMHWFEYALRDFANAERWASPAGAIVMHDCLAVAEPCARRARSSQFWVGDTWKALEAILDYRPDLTVHVIATPPSGLVVVRGLSPGSTVLFDAMDEIVSRYRELDYPYSPERWSSRYRMVGADDAGIAKALDSR
jgi:hypothetical protein